MNPPEDNQGDGRIDAQRLDYLRLRLVELGETYSRWEETPDRRRLASRLEATEDEIEVLLLAERSSGGSSAAPQAWGSDFDILDELGGGAQGIVYLARQKSLGREVALKVLRPGPSLTEKGRSRFHREAQALAAIDHPGVCRIHASVEERGELALVMQQIPGDSLDQLLDRKPGPGTASEVAPGRQPFPMSRRTTIAIKISEAVAAIHEQGILHRDLKPSNIVLRGEDDPVIVDFGLADWHAPGLAMTSGAVGTPAYLAPELVARNPGPATIATDLFSVGVLLYQILVGRFPYSAQSVQHLAIQKASARFPWPRRAEPRLSRDLALVIATLLQPDPAHRYPSAAALVSDLKACAAGHPISTRLTWWTRLARATARHPRVALATMGTSILVGLLAISLLRTLASERILRGDLHQRTVDLSRTLERSEILASSRRLQRLLEEADGALPCFRPEHRAAIERWLSVAESLAANLGTWKARLSELRSLGTPGSLSVGLADRLLDESLHRRMRSIELQIEGMKSTLANPDAPDRTREVVIRRLEQARARHSYLADLKATDTRRLFADAETRAEHDALLDSIRELEDFVQPYAPGRTLHRTRLYLEKIDRLERERPVDFEDAWEGFMERRERTGMARSWLEAVKAACPDLVPIGVDPQSRMEEFAHWLSGTLPPPRGKEGRIEWGPHTGMVLVLLPPCAVGLPVPAVPERRVLLGIVLVSKFETTQAQWHNLTDDWPALSSGANFEVDIKPRHPVSGISFETASQVAQRFGFQLPSNLQWGRFLLGPKEYVVPDPKQSNLYDASAAEQRLRPRDRVLPWDDGHAASAPVGSYPASPLGLFDLCGNVAEWCADSYDQEWRQVREGDGYCSPGTDGARVVRGGSFSDSASGANPENLRFQRPADSEFDLGVRLVRLLPPP